MKFSIIIPTLNEEKRLPLLLTDLAAQIYKGFEIIVVDGQSDDFTQRIALSWQKRLPLKLISTPIHNVSYQRNLGAKKAKADQILFMDADSRLPTFFLSDFQKKIVENKSDIASTLVRPETNYLYDILGITAINLHIILTKFCSKPFVIEAAICFKKSTFNKLKGFNTNLPCGEGGDIVARAIKKGYKLSIFGKPRYSYSLRRTKKMGMLRTAATATILELSRLLGIKLSKEKKCQLYPMNGGKFYD